MNEELAKSLEALRRDPAVVVTLYRQLFDAILIALVADANVSLREIAFLTYPTGDGIAEVPVFTNHERPLLRQLEKENGATRLEISGSELWPKLLDFVQSGECEIAVDPGEHHSIAINRELLLGIVKTKGRVA
jgi:type III secretion system (T3SS) SseB-like protein